MKTLRAPATLAVASGLLLAFGILIASLGPALPDLARSTGHDLASLGRVFTALFLGAFLAQLVVGPLNDRMGQRWLLLAGALLLALGMLGMTSSRSLPLLLGCAAMSGVGQGTLVITAHVLVAGLFSVRPAAALNLMNVFFGVGAVTGPAVAGLSLRWWGSALPALWLGVGVLLMLALLIPFVAVAPRAASGDASAGDASAGAASGDAPGGRPAGRVYGAPVLWALGVMLFAYVGVENAMGGWTATYLERATGMAPDSAALVTAGFWLALTCGRLVGAALGTRVTSAALLGISLGGSVASGVLLVAGSGLGTGLVPTVAAVLLLGLCFGPVFPTAMAITTATFARASGTAASMVVALGNGGGAVLPWLQGVLLAEHGPRAGAWLVLAITGAMLLAYLGYRALARGHRERLAPG